MTDESEKQKRRWKGALSDRGDFVVLLRSGVGTPSAPPAYGVVEEIGVADITVRWANGTVGHLRPDGGQWVAKVIPVDEEAASIPQYALRERQEWAIQQEELAWVDQLEPWRRDLGV